MFRKFITLATLVALFAPSFISSKEPEKPAEKPDASVSKVDGLELPADQTVGWDEGFVNIQAKCKGDVRWLPIANGKVKFASVPGNAIIVSIPPQGGVVTLFAVGLVDGKLTEFARTNITVVPPKNDATSVPVGNYHVTFLMDMNRTTPQLASILNSQNLRQAITSRGNFFRLYDIKSPIVAQKKFDSIIQKIGGSAILVIQRGDGTVVLSEAVPATEQDVIQSIVRATGG